VRCAPATRAGDARSARFLVVERLRPERFAVTPRDHAIARSDLIMLISLDGRERTEKAYGVTLEAAGLRVAHVSAMPTSSASSRLSSPQPEGEGQLLDRSGEPEPQSVPGVSCRHTCRR
jgi:hypothetical protein